MRSTLIIRIRNILVASLVATSAGWPTAPARADVSAANPHFYVGGPSADSPGDGLTWDTAYGNLEYALQQMGSKPTCQANSCELWVGEGTYMPVTLHADFLLDGTVQLYGGFVGNETALSQRDWRVHTTTLYGHSYRVVHANHFAGVLDGFTISGGNNDLDVYGGGIYLECGVAQFRNLTITANTVKPSAGGMGGGVLIMGGNCSSQSGYYSTFLNVTVSNNSASMGGALYVLAHIPHLINVNILGNSASVAPGIYDNSAAPVLTNVTVLNNGIYNTNNSDPVLANTVVYSGLGSVFSNADVDSVPTVSYSMISSCNGSGVWAASCGTNGGHNLADADPLFVDANDTHLQENSPLINKGDSTLVPAPNIPTDLDGHTRIVGVAVDIGAYEFQHANTPPVVTAFSRAGRHNTRLAFTRADFEAAFSDADGDQLTAVRITTLPEEGTLLLDQTTVSITQTISAASLSLLGYTPPADWGGSVNVGWTASDGLAFATSPAVIHVQISSHELFLPTLRKAPQ